VWLVAFVTVERIVVTVTVWTLEWVEATTPKEDQHITDLGNGCQAPS